MGDGASVVRLIGVSYGGHILEHGTSKPGRWLRGRRFRATLWIAAIEGLLYVVHVLHWWEAVALAAIAVLVWLYAGRRSRADVVREATWIFAVSQLLVLCVPLALAVLTAFAIGIVVILAIAALIFLFTERP
jgi:hypothetical protein